MNEFSTILTGSSLLAFIMCISLAIAIFRHAEHSFETRNLLLLLMLMAFESFLFMMDGSFKSFLADAGARTRYLLDNTVYLLQIGIFATVAHFVVLQLLRLIPRRKDLAGSPAASGIAWLKPLYLLLAVVIFGTAALGIGQHIYKMLETLRTASLGVILPGLLSEAPSGVILRFLTGIGLFAQLIGLGYIYRWKLPGKKASAIPDMEEEWKLWNSSTLLLITVSATSPIQISQQWDFSLELMWFLLAAVSILPVIYFKMRFVFFDVLIKRGLFLILLAITGYIYFYHCVTPLQAAVGITNPAAATIVMYLGIILFTLIWVFSYGRMNRLLDQVLFGRADYKRLIPEISRAMQQYVDPASLLGYVTGKLKKVMEAENVTFSARGKGSGQNVSFESGHEGTATRQADTAVLEVRAGDRLFGHLHLGKRRTGQKYQSEDLSFLGKIAGQLAGMLQNLELREERERQRQREQKLVELSSQAELRALKAQINPHFLFNALNSLAELTSENPEAAEKAIMDLSQVFRYVLAATERDSAKLGEEADFLKAYLSVEKIRFEDRLRFEIDIPEDLRECRIPPMIIQPLVENAVKHGITPSIAGGKIVVRARLIGQYLQISVEDNGVGFEAGTMTIPRNNGVGLKNVRARVEMLNPQKSLEIKSEPGVGTTVSFEIPAKTQDLVGEKLQTSEGAL